MGAAFGVGMAFGMASVNLFGRRLDQDLLFAGSIGRSDLPGGDPQALLDGIRDKLFGLDDETLVYPGHGPATTIGQEKASNPFVGAGRLWTPGA